ncbi:hypothetical protein O3G_MSEX000922 [Manduca sexta]|nr:hypothetical protein O3G_MSEX000922 [Manduca sexta]KAG6439614.1 hypothetical protein O3G_MSEX000922 [Manduca sexta]
MRPSPPPPPRPPGRRDPRRCPGTPSIRPWAATTAWRACRLCSIRS